MDRLTASRVEVSASTSTAKRAQRCRHACSCFTSNSENAGARVVRIVAASAAEAIAGSREVAKAATFSTTTGTPSHSSRVSSCATCPSSTTVSWLAGWSATVVRAATHTRTWLCTVSTSSSTVPPSTSFACTGRRCRLASSAYSVTLPLTTLPSSPERTCTVPSQPSATSIVSIAARCESAIETSRRWRTRSRCPSGVLNTAVRLSNPRRRSSSRRSDDAASPPSDHHDPSATRRSVGSQFGALTRCSSCIQRPATRVESRL